MIVRYVRPLTEEQRALVESTMKNDAAHRARMRAQGLLLSHQGLSIKAIAKIHHVDRDTVSTWIKKWEKHGDKSLHDQPRSGRPPKLSATEKELAKQYSKEAPRSLRNVVERLAQKTAKRLSISSLKRLAKKARLRWKRVRKSFKSLRDPSAFAKGQRELEALQKQEDKGKIALYYFDESGFTLDPSPVKVILPLSFCYTTGLLHRLSGGGHHAGQSVRTFYGEKSHVRDGAWHAGTHPGRGPTRYLVCPDSPEAVHAHRGVFNRL
jgi:transposase